MYGISWTGQQEESFWMGGGMSSSTTINVTVAAFLSLFIYIHSTFSLNHSQKLTKRRMYCSSSKCATRTVQNTIYSDRMSIRYLDVHLQYISDISISLVVSYVSDPSQCI